MAVGLGVPLARGSRSTVYAWGRDAVAKVPLPSTPEGWIETEASFAALVLSAGAPVPRLFGVERIDGRAVSIYERVDGQSMWEHMVRQPQSIGPLAQQLAELQARVFTLVPPVQLPAQHDRVTSKIRIAARSVDGSLLDALKHVPAPMRRQLCHGDLHPGNVIMGGDGPVLIDWLDVSRGDALGDIARTALLLSDVAAGTAGPRHLVDATREHLASMTQAYLAAAAEFAPIDDVDLDRWMAVLAVARLAEGIEPEGLLTLWHRWHRRHGPARDAAPLTSARARGAS